MEKYKVFIKMKQIFQIIMHTKFKLPVACRYIATCPISSHDLSYISATTISTNSIQDFLTEVGKDILIENIVGASPRKDILKVYVL